MFVCHCPGENVIAVAEAAFGLLDCPVRCIPDNVNVIPNGKWNKQAFGTEGRSSFEKILSKTSC